MRGRCRSPFTGGGPVVRPSSPRTWRGAARSIPRKATCAALQNAASIAGLLLTTESVVVERPEKEKAPAMPGGGGRGDMY